MGEGAPVGNTKLCKGAAEACREPPCIDPAKLGIGDTVVMGETIDEIGTGGGPAVLCGCCPPTNPCAVTKPAAAAVAPNCGCCMASAEYRCS
mmetsp:Transcript_6188/g.17630  ORF Transcript_6188/g.17630 Transcript_6188/m.17630 type:complete len:92 (-) Transcript_6188:3033-3308(-)